MGFELALCNEVLRVMSFEEQCRTASLLGYDALEVAPFTLDDQPHLLPSERRKEIRTIAADAGLKISGLHWLLLAPPGLSINTSDSAVRQHTIDVMRALIELCTDLGGKTLVHGSPHQRSVEKPEDYQEAWQLARDTLSAIAPDAEAAGVNYCIEPLSRAETNFINSVAKAVRMAEEVASPAICTMIDSRAARSEEDLSLENLIEHWLPTGWVRHVHFNDQNRRAPGQGEDEFASVVATLQRLNYQGTVGIEPFDYVPDGRSAAAFAAGYMRGIREGLTAR